MKLDRLKVNNPIKTEKVSTDIEIDGSFQCQQCNYENDTAKMRDGNIFWDCSECGYRSVASRG